MFRGGSFQIFESRKIFDSYAHLITLSCVMDVVVALVNAIVVPVSLETTDQFRVFHLFHPLDPKLEKPENRLMLMNEICHPETSRKE